MARPSLTRKRLLGIDRSDGPPPETQKGQPLRPWTIPNAISYVRLALLPVFLVVALSSGDGRDTLAVALYFVIGWGDQLDGVAARLTGQYSRLGALLDPLTDRALVISGVAVCWHFELLPRWALAVLVARECGMLALARYGLRHGFDVAINWPGRLAVWPVMTAIFMALVELFDAAEISLYIGLGLSLLSFAMYARLGLRSRAST